MEAASFRPAFGHLALLVQIPGVDVEDRMLAEKGSEFTAREYVTLGARVEAAKHWLRVYAPDRAKIEVKRDLPDAVTRLGDDQRVYLAALGQAAERQRPTTGEEWQKLIFDTATDGELAPGRAFGALYIAFLARTNGPRAGWLLASLDHEFVFDRLRTAGGGLARA